MNLKILLPFQVFAQEHSILSLVAQTPRRFVWPLPQRLDCVAALSPGILSYTTAAGETCLAVDEGVLIKTGMTSWSPSATPSGAATSANCVPPLKTNFLSWTNNKQASATVLAKLESTFVARFVKYSHG